MKDKKRGDNHINKLVLPYLKKNSFTWIMSTLEEDKAGTDITIRRDTEQYKVQIKCDDRTGDTKNFYLQDTKFKPDNTSDVVFYVDCKNKEMFLLRTQDIIDNWDKICDIAREHDMPNFKGDKVYHTKGRIISVDDLASLIIINTVKLGVK